MQTGGGSEDNAPAPSVTDRYAQHIRLVFSSNEAWVMNMMLHTMSRITDHDIPLYKLKSALRAAITELALNSDATILEAKESIIVHQLANRATRIATEMLSSKI